MFLQYLIKYTHCSCVDPITRASRYKVFMKQRKSKYKQNLQGLFLDVRIGPFFIVIFDGCKNSFVDSKLGNTLINF